MNKKYAYCVGNNYPGTSAELSGCVNDANDWGQHLATLGYEVLVQTEVPKAQFLRELSDRVRRLGFGDKLVVTYSGHGTWLYDSDGDEADGRDEALVMTDYAQGGLVTDDELHAIFDAAKAGSSRLLLSDSCHSGTGNRFLARYPETPTPPGKTHKPRFLPPTEFRKISETRAMDAEEALGANPRTSSSLISGCGDLEYSYDAWFYDEAGWRANGAFTRAALDTYRPGMSLKAWYNAIRQVLPGEYPQTPQLTALSAYRLYSRAI